MVIYDKHYQKENYFGNPCPELVEFFKNYEPKGTVLDLGCGQGRDALAVARLGYDVVGVDISQIGVNQMTTQGKSENLDIKGIVEDIYEFEPFYEYDIVLLDSMLHFYKKDKEKEIKLVKKIIMNLKLNSLFVILVNNSKNTEKVLEKVLSESNNKWIVIEDKYIDYLDFNTIYKMLVVKKIR